VKQALEVTVDVVEDGRICIQSPDYGGGEQRVYISPEQVDLLIEWLKQEKEEALKKRVIKPDA
jgi:integrase